MKYFFTKKSKTALDKTIFPRYSTHRPYDNQISGYVVDTGVDVYEWTKEIMGNYLIDSLSN